MIEQAAHDLADLRRELASLEMTRKFDFKAHAASAEEFRKGVASFTGKGLSLFSSDNPFNLSKVGGEGGIK